MARNSQLKVEVVGDTARLERALESSQQKMQRWGRNIGSHGRSLTRWVSGPIAGAAGGLALLAQREGERADALLDAQARTQASTETLQEYRHVAGQAGVDTEFFENATKDMSRQLASARQGTGRAAEAFDELDISIRDSNGEVRSTGELTEEAMNKLAGMGSESRRAAIAQDLFKSSQQDVLAVVAQGSDELDRQRQEAHELGVVQSEDALQSANQFRQGLERLKTMVSGLGSTIGGEFAPILTDHLVPLFEDRVVPAAQTVAEKVADLARWFTDLSPRTQAIIAAVAGLVATLGPLLVVVGAVVSAIGTLMPVLAAVAGAISLPVVAIGALVAALVYAYTQSETFRNIVNAVFGFVRDFIVEQITLVRDFIRQFVAVATAVWQRWGDDILAYATRTWNNIKQMIGGILDVIRGIFNTFAGLFTGDWQRAWQGIQQIGEGIWNVITALWDQALNTIQNLGRIALEALQGLWQRIWTAIKDWASDRIDDVVGFVSDLPGRALSALDSAWGAWQEFWRNVWQAAADWALERFDDVVGWVTDLPGRAKDALSGAWETYQEFWREKWRQASGFVSDRFGDMVQDHREFPGEAKGALSEVWGTLRSFWDNEMRGVRDFAGARFDDVVGFLRTLPGRAREALATTWSGFHVWWNEQFIGIKDWVGNRIDDVVGFFRDLPGRIRSALSNLGSTIRNAFSFDLSIGGEAGGPGDGAMPPGGSVINRLNAFMDSTGIGHRTTSTFRPGDSGYHGMGRAVDFAGPTPGYNTPALRRIQRAWVPLAASGQLRELIGPDPRMNFKNGRRGPGVYPPRTQEAHQNHVHTAMRSGGTIVEPVFGVGRSGRTYSFGEEGAETVTPGHSRGGDGADLERALLAELRAIRKQLAQPERHYHAEVHGETAEPITEDGIVRRLRRLETLTS